MAKHGFDTRGLERCPFMPTFGPPPVMFERGEGSWLWDTDGKRYLDLLSGIAVTSLGHCHPAVADAVAEQAHRLDHVANYFTNPVTADVAIALDRLVGGGGQLFFTNSGAEANECAFKLARRWGGAPHGRYKIISAYGSFHGRTMAALAATGQPARHEPFQPLPPGFSHVAFGDVADLAAHLDDRTAAVILEPVQGEGGVIPLPAGVLRQVRELCDERGVLLIVDEVQTGLGRTGAWFGFQHDDVRPDIVTMAKALGNGMPVGACWARADVAAAFEPGDHGTTQGGNPLSAAAARATLTTMEAEDVVGRAQRQGARLADGLRALPGVDHVRGRGLLLAAELAAGRDAKAVWTELLARGVVANAVNPTALRFTPSLLISDDEVDHGLAVLADVLA
jgi:predicted acetylornithine/succinylornithine family transaminase